MTDDDLLAGFVDRRLFVERRRHPSSVLHDLLLTSDDVAEFLGQLITIAVTVIGDGLCATVVVARDGESTMVARSDEHAARYDEALFGQHDSPQLGATGSGRIQLLEDLVDDDRFIERRPACSAVGLRSAMLLPLNAGPDVTGELRLYSRSAHSFTAARQSAAQIFAAEASRTIDLAVRRSHERETTRQLRAALISRTTIDQGIGIIMGQNGCDAETAFGILRASSQNRNVKLRLVSAEIITAVTRKIPSQGRPFHD
ncbi:GAF and ANTAR domain-containing protein [Pengzhenrongella sp.]|uniref:GAF and ANTAR domain-containing protein n=1 Tax=Pengzhenrongella sp. TaxID=2888820 RepID=UPI002F9285B3